MFKRLFFCLFMGWLVLSAGLAGAAPAVTDDRGAEVLARECVTLIQERRYAEAADLFHYPPHYSRDRRRNDAYHVEHNLMDMVGEFGAPEVSAPFEGTAYIFDLGTSGGDRVYWRDHEGESRTLRYRARFANVGEGFIEVQVVMLSGRPEVRTVSFGLSALRPGARERIAAIKTRLVEARRSRADLTILSEV